MEIDVTIEEPYVDDVEIDFSKYTNEERYDIIHSFIHHKFCVFEDIELTFEGNASVFIPRTETLYANGVRIDYIQDVEIGVYKFYSMDIVELIETIVHGGVFIFSDVELCCIAEIPIETREW